MWDLKENFSKVDISIVCEGTYPFSTGGVSSVIDTLIKGLPQFTFGVIHLCWDDESPDSSKFTRPKNLRWIDKIYLSPKMHQSNNKAKGIQELDKKAQISLQKILQALSSDDFENISSLYRDLTENLPNKLSVISDIFYDVEFLKYLVKNFFSENITYNEALWLSHEFTGILASLLSHNYPKANIYHSHTNGYAGLAAVFAKWQNSGKFILSEHSLYVRDAINFLPKANKSYTGGEHFPIPIGEIKPIFWENWFRKMGKFIYSQVDASTYLYQNAYLEARDYGHYKKDSVRIIPNGIKNAKFISVREKNKKRNKDRFDKDYIWTIAFIGRIVPIKGILGFLDSLNHLAQKRSNFRVLLVGPIHEDPEYYQFCQNKISQMKLDRMIFFTGNQNIFDILPHVDLMTLPSLSEAFPMACLEAMASGIPMVSYNVGSVKTMLTDKVSTSDRIPSKLNNSAGIVIPEGDFESFSNGLHLLMTDENRYLTLQKNGPIRIDRYFSDSLFLNAFQNIYQKEIDGYCDKKENNIKNLDSYSSIRSRVLRI